MGLKVYINGEFKDKSEAAVSVYDHGLLYGDGVFEGIRAYCGEVFRCKEHVDRLYDSAKAIALTIPLDKDEMIEAIHETLAINDLQSAYIRAVITRGIGTLGLDPTKCSEPQVIIITDEIALYPENFYEQGLEVITVPTQRTPHNALSPKIKSLNYLNNIMAKVEGLQAGVIEAIMLNSQGYIAECTGDNIFVVSEGELITPPPEAGILEGITRGVVMDLARELDIPVNEENLTRFDLYTADEAFLTGTAAEIVPVVRIDSRGIGTGEPGEITHRLLEKYREVTGCN